MHASDKAMHVCVRCYTYVACLIGWPFKSNKAAPRVQDLTGRTFPVSSWKDISTFKNPIEEIIFDLPNLSAYNNVRILPRLLCFC